MIMLHGVQTTSGVQIGTLALELGESGLGVGGPFASKKMLENRKFQA